MSVPRLEKEFYTLEEIAELLSVTYNLIYRLVRNGQIPASRIGKLYRISRTDLQDYLARTKTEPPSGHQCSVCGKQYVSRLSIKGVCEKCDAIICNDCWTRKNVRLCDKHKK